MQDDFFYKYKNKSSNIEEIDIVLHNCFLKSLKDDNAEDNMTVMNSRNDVDTMLENRNNIINENRDLFTHHTDTMDSIRSNVRGQSKSNENTSSSLANRSTNNNQIFRNNYSPNFSQQSEHNANYSSRNFNLNDYNNTHSRNYQYYEGGGGRGLHRGIHGGRGRSYLNY